MTYTPHNPIPVVGLHVFLGEYFFIKCLCFYWSENITCPLWLAKFFLNLFAVSKSLLALLRRVGHLNTEKHSFQISRRYTCQHIKKKSNGQERQVKTIMNLVLVCPFFAFSVNRTRVSMMIQCELFYSLTGLTMQRLKITNLSPNVR